MVIEALCAIGRGDAVDKWLAVYRPQLIVSSAARERITDLTWRTELGRLNRYSDCEVFFNNQLKESSWAEVLDRWTTRFWRRAFPLPPRME